MKKIDGEIAAMEHLLWKKPTRSGNHSHPAGNLFSGMPVTVRFQSDVEEMSERRLAKVTAQGKLWSAGCE